MAEPQNIQTTIPTQSSNTQSSASTNATPVLNPTQTAPANPQTNLNLNHLLPIKLDANNFLLWKSLVLPSLSGHDLDGLLLSTKMSPPEWINVTEGREIRTVLNPEFFQWRRLDQLLLSWLLSSMTEGVLSQVIGCPTAHEAWVAIERLYSSQSRARILQLRSQLQTTRKGSLSISEYFQKMRNIADNLAAAGQAISEDDLLLYILAGIGAEYDSVVVNVTSRHDSMVLQEGYALLLNHENRLEQQNAVANIEIHVV